MAVLKCKMCGGDMELTADKTFGTCEYCGSSMTLPKVDDEQRVAAFNRGNHFRRIGEFDKALAVYERIVRDNETDAEAHWCCALCRFGIEYVEDPTTYEWLPTCHRASFDSFLEDVDYKAALEYSEGITRRQYLKDGAKIAEVQRGILATSQNTEPYDVFICYKESDENGERTRDSLMAQEIYYQLTEQGRRVFFARITLEDIAGTQYEPYIFAALNSAKVMVVVGTKSEYLNAVWVKNEWSRFLAMMKKDRHKILLPCYRDMDPYDMPDQLSVLQSYDMAKIGFIQDLIRGIAKVLNAEQKPETVKETVIVQQPSAPTNTAPLLKRAFMFLEDGEWDNADEYCEKVLDMEPENALAYLGKLMAELCVSNMEELKDEQEPFDDENNYHKVIRFADDALRNTLEGYIDHINTRNENARLNGIYNNAKRVMDSAKTEFNYKEAARMFLTISDYEDSEALAQECYELAEVARKDAIFMEAKRDMEYMLLNKIEKAIELFESIPGWKDADERIIICRQKLEELKIKEAAKEQVREQQRLIDEQKRKDQEKRKKTVITIAGTVVTIALTVVLLITQVIIPGNNYKKAEEFLANGQYEEAAAAFKSLGNYKDSSKQYQEASLANQYNDGIMLLSWGENQESENPDAVQLLQKIRTWVEEEELQETIPVATDASAVAFFEEEEVPEFTSKELFAIECFENAKYIFENLGAYRDSAYMAKHATGLIQKLEEQKEEEFLAEEYAAAEKLAENGETAKAALSFGKLGNYRDAKERCLSLWDTSNNRKTISAGWYHTVGLKNDGTVIAIGSPEGGRCDISNWKNMRAISAGGYYTAGLQSDGTVLAVGFNDYNQLNVGGWTDIVRISSGTDHTVALKADGTVVAVGSNKYGQCDVSGWTDIIAVEATGCHTFGLKTDGSIVKAGEDAGCKCDISNWKNIVSINAQINSIVGLKEDGTVVEADCFYRNRFDISTWTDIVDIDVGYWHAVGLKSDGTVVAVEATDLPNYVKHGQCSVDGWRDIVSISAGSHHTVGLKKDGTVLAVGYNISGQCDVSDWKGIKLPQ